MFGVSVPTVVGWVDSGKVTAYRTPGGHRRIEARSLATFAWEQGRSIPPQLEHYGERKLRVLVVDDEPDFLLLVRETLAMSEGIEVATASSGFMAGLQLGRLRPDLVLLDLMMPDVDGFEVFRMLRDDEETADIPVVACSAFASRAVERRVEEAGFTAFLPKPLALGDLESTILRLLQPESQ